MLIVSILTFITNLAMLVIAIFGIVIPIKNNFRKEQEKSDKAMGILNTIVGDKNRRLNLDISVLEICKIEPLTKTELNKEESTEEKSLSMKEAHDIKIERFINKNVESIAYIISYLENEKFIERIEELRNEYSDFLFSKFNMMKNDDIKKLKERIELIDEVIEDTRNMYELIPENHRKNKSVIDVGKYLKEKNYKDLKENSNSIIQAIPIFQEIEEYKGKIKNINQKFSRENIS